MPRGGWHKAGGRGKDIARRECGGGGGGGGKGGCGMTTLSNGVKIIHFGLFRRSRLLLSGLRVSLKKGEVNIETRPSESKPAMSARPRTTNTQREADLCCRYRVKPQRWELDTHRSATHTTSNEQKRTRARDGIRSTRTLSFKLSENSRRSARVGSSFPQTASRSILVSPEPPSAVGLNALLKQGVGGARDRPPRDALRRS